MSSARKSAAAASAAKQKKIAIGGAVLLVGVLFIQGPKVMKMLSGGSSASSAPAPAAIAPPVTPGAVPAAPAATPVSAVPEAGGTKFVSFETFGTKDPFAPQVDLNSPAAAAANNADEVADGDTADTAPESAQENATDSTSSAAAAPATTGTARSSTSSGAPTSSSTAKPTFKVTTGTSTASATLTVNGKRQVVTVNHDFPAGDPVFTLEGVTSGSASVAIAGGSLKTGGKTFTLTVGTPLTLLNTATGTKYKLELLSTAPAGA